MPRTHLTQDAAPAELAEIAAQVGAQIAAARLRRRWTQDDLATRAGVTRPTIRRVENGELGTGFGAYLAALWAMGLQRGMLAVASLEQDAEGATLAAARLGTRARAAREVNDEF